MMVSRSVGTTISDVRAIVAAGPQSNVTTPPCVTALCSAAAVQPAPPVPTTVLGWEVSASARGTAQVIAGGGPASTGAGEPSMPCGDPSSEPAGAASAPAGCPPLDDDPDDDPDEDAPDEDEDPGDPSAAPPGAEELEPHP